MAGELVDATVEAYYSSAWQDITTYVYTSEGIGIQRGIRNEGGRVDPARMTLTLNNRDGRFSPRNPSSPLYGLIGRNTPIRVSAGLAGGTQVVRFVGEVVAWPSRWDLSGRDVRVPLQAAGLLRRLGVKGKPLESAIRRYWLGLPASIGTLLAYVPLEESSDAFNRAANLVPGTSQIVYATGAAPDYPRRPGFGGDDSLPGSAPLPDWPVIDYFGWSFGSTVAADDSREWHVIVEARVPASSGEIWLTEWRTTGGTYNEWALKVNSSGKVQVVAENDSSTVTHTSTADSIDDGVWRTISAIAEQSGTSQIVAIHVGDSHETFTDTTTTVGEVSRIRPRPMFASSSGKEPIGLAHAAVVAAGRLRASVLQPPVGGHAGEMAENRVDRLCLGGGISFDGPGTEAASDDFDRTSTDEWGTSTSGDDWLEVGGAASDYSVSGGEGHITATDVSNPRIVRLDGLSMLDMDVQFTVAPNEIPTTSGGISLLQVGACLRDIDDTNRYIAQVGFSQTFSGTNEAEVWLAISIEEDGTVASLTPTPAVGVYEASDLWSVRAQIVGPTIRMKAWPAGETQPSVWLLEVTDGTLTGAGTAGVRLTLGSTITSAPVTVDITDLVVREITPTALMGPQPRAQLFTALTECGNAEAGGATAPVLVETRDEAGIGFNPLRDLTFQSPTGLTLDYDGKNLSLPFEPTPDDRSLANDITARDNEDASARVTLETGALSVQAPPDGVGVYDKTLTVNVASGEQLPNVAGWALHHGTWDEDRYPVIRSNIRALSTRTGGATLVTDALALDAGDVIIIENPPSWMPPDDIEQLVLGYREDISREGWVIDWHTTPAGPYRVGQRLATSDTPGAADPVRRDTAGSVLDAEFVAGTDTSMDVETTQGPLWGVTGAANMDFPLDVFVAGARVRVTAIAAAVGQVQTFTVNATIVNGVTKTIPAGTAVRLWHPAVRGL